MKGIIRLPPSRLVISILAINPMLSEMAVKVVKLAVAQNPHAVRIWIKAADLEVEQRSKRRVFRKVITNIDWGCVCVSSVE